MDPLPRGMLGEASGDVCPMRGGTPGRPCRCCHLGEGLLMSVRARDQQVGLGCSCWRPRLGTLQARDLAGSVVTGGRGGWRSGLLSSCLVGGSK